MKRIFLTLTMIVLTLTMSAPLYAYDCEVDGIFYYRISATDLEVAYKVFSDNNRTAYTGSVTIPATVTYNGKTFNVTSIGEYAFRDCNSLSSVNIPSSVKTIKNYAFYNCSSLSSLNIPAGVSNFGAGVFEGCSSLMSVEIPSGMTAIETETFFGCASLKSVVIPEGVKSIAAGAFAYCTSLNSIYCLSATAPSCEANAFDKVDLTWCTIYVPATGATSYKEGKVWKDFFIEEFSGKLEDIKDRQ